MLQEMVGTDVLMLVRIVLCFVTSYLFYYIAKSEPIIEALRPRLCTVEYEPRLALKAYFVVRRLIPYVTPITTQHSLPGTSTNIDGVHNEIVSPS